MTSNSESMVNPGSNQDVLRHANSMTGSLDGLSLYGKFDSMIKYYLDASGDPKVRHWPLLQESPVYCVLLSMAYLAFVWLVPYWMRHRQAFNLRYFMALYNGALVVLSAYMLFEIVYSSYLAGYGLLCNRFDINMLRQDPDNVILLRMAKVLWLFFFSKAIEFVDTILMVLRKKDDQITFLHVYHHVSMLNIWWFVVNFVPAGLSVFSPALNCFVHVIMYSYYGLSVFPSLRPYLWWKRYITQMQLLQFVIILSHTSYSYATSCPYPLWAYSMLSGYMISLIVLFGNFYLHAYVKGRRSSPTVASAADKDYTAASNCLAEATRRKARAERASPTHPKKTA